MTAQLYIEKPRRKVTNKALVTSPKRGVVTISLMNPPLTYRAGTKRVHTTTYYNC
ncbi:hypothetical protein H0W26_05285 [Candidatus Dependentiae bacterium]|nr:hypothetical protein [Candidatus Dependentiae bacterium]